jgi:hypothetical protein
MSYDNGVSMTFVGHPDLFKEKDGVRKINPLMPTTVAQATRMLELKINWAEVIINIDGQPGQPGTVIPDGAKVQVLPKTTWEDAEG